jgi:hypothetical protein
MSSQYTTETSPTSADPDSVTSVRASGNASDERVSLAPLTPEEALKGLLNTPPMEDED